MPRLPQPRAGEKIQVRNRDVAFSFWPARPARAHHAQQSLLFSLDPWPIIRRVIESKCPRPRVAEALACFRQARDFYTAGTGDSIEAARPLALYYSYMNLTKSYCLTFGSSSTFARAEHGLSEQLGTGGRELHDAYLRAFPSPNVQSGKLQNFDELRKAITGHGTTTVTEYNLPQLLPQILPGHRLWAQATQKKERFITLQDIEFWHNPESRDIWLNLFFFSDDLSRLGVTHRKLLSESGLFSSFREVACTKELNGRSLICFEQIQPLPCPDSYYADHIHRLISIVKPNLWVAVSTIPPYRRYYVYMCPPAERQNLLPQILSIYAVTYYLGSITRYRPHHFDALVGGAFGPRIQDFVSGQPQQFLYLMASEFSKQEVARPSLI